MSTSGAAVTYLGPSDLAELDSILDCTHTADQYPIAEAVEQQVVVYDGQRLRQIVYGHKEASAQGAVSTPAHAHSYTALLLELARVFDSGPGVLVVRGLVAEDVVDEATRVFEEVMRAERSASGFHASDHFSAAGSNDRLWNSFEKHCIAKVDSFVRYYNNDVLQAVACAWLGPGGQMTAQVNSVNPGCPAQTPHRDYHMGFLAHAALQAFPLHAHRASPLLTLQGAVAHTHMPLSAGPTIFLPHSQKIPKGYLMFAKQPGSGGEGGEECVPPPFLELFRARAVQLPLHKGDGVFFNPALVHAAGTNTGASPRVANLFQISSVFGRAMESVDRDRVCRHLYPTLLRAVQAGRLVDEFEAVIAATADGYAFPTNLDTDPPVCGYAPATQADLMRTALRRGDSPEAFEALVAQKRAVRAA